MPTLLFLLGCLPPILWDTARSLDSGGTGETGADTDTGAETGGETANETGETGDTDGEPCGGEATCAATLAGVRVTTEDLSTSADLYATPNGPGTVEIAATNLAQGTSGAATASGVVTVATRRVELDVAVTPSGAPDYSLTVSFTVKDLSPGQWTFVSAGRERTATIE